ncbi:unnamed protein product [Cuscuta campestris]|uniref:Uncharacterized protein n=1 Tax=Cuscuta campestris TaxID=132261 RepID=A0A484KK43_9ASTE|nr:unnamed protein product [Cuscuta campestris]
MYDDQPDPRIEEILWTEERIRNLDLALAVECSSFQPPYCRDYTQTCEEQIEANRDAIQARERFLKTVQEQKKLLQIQKELKFKSEQREHLEQMQKMLEDFKKTMEQQTLQIQMEKVVALVEDKESETESETESNNVSILEYPQTPSPLYMENKITFAEMIARDTVVMLLESPKSQIVQEVKHTEGPVSESPSPAAPETLEELVQAALEKVTFSSYLITSCKMSLSN